MNAFTLPIPTYQCHKRVQALRIKAVVPNPRGYELHFEDERFCPIEVCSAWVETKAAVDRGYAIWRDDDGSLGFSPAAAFEAGYTLLETADGAVRSPDWSGWPGGPSEVEAALASRDAEIDLQRREIELLRAVLENALSARMAGQNIDFQEMHDALMLRNFPLPVKSFKLSPGTLEKVGPATQAAREVGK